MAEEAGFREALAEWLELELESHDGYITWDRFKSAAVLLHEEHTRALEQELEVERAVVRVERGMRRIAEREAADLREEIGRLSKGLFDLSPERNAALVGNAVDSALAWVADLREKLAAQEAQANTLLRAVEGRMIAESESLLEKLAALEEENKSLCFAMSEKVLELELADKTTVAADAARREAEQVAASQIADVVRRSGDDVAHWRERAERAEKALRKIEHLRSDYPARDMREIARAALTPETPAEPVSRETPDGKE